MNNTPDEYINNSKNEASSIGREKDGLICPVKKLVNPVSRIPKNETVQSCEEKTLINPVSRILKKKDSEHCNSSFALKLKENKTTGNMVLHTMMFPQMHEDTTMTKLESKDFRVDNYVFHNSGLYFIDETMRETKISNFWVEIITEKNYINLLGDAKSNVIDTEVSVKWKVRIFCANRWFEGEVSRDELQNEKRLLALTRDRAVLESSNQTKNLYCKYIGKLIEQENFNLENVYATSGWVYRQDMGWIYLTDKGAIGIPGCNCYTDVPYTFNYISLAVGTKEIFQDFWNLRFICSNRMENSIFLMHFSCLATITTFFQLCGHGINFVVAMVGETNSFKTSCAKVFTRMFNRNESSGVDIRFNSSEVAITEEMERYGDAIMTVDDYIPYESKQELNIQKKN